MTDILLINPNTTASITDLVLKTARGFARPDTTLRALTGATLLLSAAALLAAGLLHGDVETIVGSGLAAYTQEPWLDGDVLRWRPAPDVSGDENIVRPVARPVPASPRRPRHGAGDGPVHREP